MNGIRVFEVRGGLGGAVIGNVYLLIILRNVNTHYMFFFSPHTVLNIPGFDAILIKNVVTGSLLLAHLIPLWLD